MAISVGSKAPDFNLKSKNSTGLVDVKLSNNFGKKNTVVLFFPLAFTGVCTQELCDITAGLSQYAGLNGVKVSMSQRGYHFLMWDDADWLVNEVKGFIANAK